MALSHLRIGALPERVAAWVALLNGLCGALACGERVELARWEHSGSAGGEGGLGGSAGESPVGAGRAGTAAFEPTGITWIADFETGDFSQWDREPQFVHDDIQIVESPVRAGRYAARFSLAPGDNPLGDDGERAELLRTGFEDEGTESWWAWSTYFPTDFAAEQGSNAWTIFAHWVSIGDPFVGCSPPLVLDVSADGKESLRLLVRGGAPKLSGSTCSAPPTKRFILATLSRERWYDFVMHVVWSADATQGEVQLWLDGREVVPLTRVATLFAGAGVYPKLGLYRSPSAVHSSLIVDELRRGSGPPEGL